MSEYNYTETKEKLMDLQLENPNPLPIHYINGFKNWMQNHHNLYLDDKEVQEIHDFMESAKEVHIGRDTDQKNLSFTMFSGKIDKFNQSGSDFIRAMVVQSPELRIKAMFLKEADMEIYIEEARKQKSKEFSLFFKNKEYESKETGEPVNWDDMFQDFYHLYDFPKAITTTQIVNSIKSGKIKLVFAEKLMESMLEEVFLREKE